MATRLFIYCWNVLSTVFWILMALCDFSFCFPSNNVSILESFLKKKIFILKSILIFYFRHWIWPLERFIVRTLFLRYNRITLKVPLWWMISVINMLLVDRYKQCIFCPVIPIGHLPWRGNALSQPLLPMNIGRLHRVLDRQRRMGSGVRRLTVICDCLHRTHCCSTDHASI